MSDLMMQPAYDLPCAPPQDWHAAHLIADTFDECGPHLVVDEMPAFSIRSISPNQRSPSPIDFGSHDDSTASAPTTDHMDVEAAGHNHNVTECADNMVSLEELNAQIMGASCNWQYGRRLCSLETIYEGKFFDTPTKRRKPSGVWMPKMRALDVAGQPNSERDVDAPEIGGNVMAVAAQSVDS